MTPEDTQLVREMREDAIYLLKFHHNMDKIATTLRRGAGAIERLSRLIDKPNLTVQGVVLNPHKDEEE
jgi:hypothetical protein